jgi:flagellin-like protein
MWKKKRSTEAVSEVVGVVLLLGMTITLFAFLNYVVFSFSFGSSPPSVNLIGTLDMDDNTVIIKHYHGDSLEGTTNVIVTIGSSSYQKSIKQMYLYDEWSFQDTNSDGKWNFGEVVRFRSSEISPDTYIQVTVVHQETNTILLTTVLQQGT